MSQSMLNQVFDPYFSTKEKGHGLGLSICHSIIQKHNGHIKVDSKQDVGTIFTIYIPASDKPPVAANELSNTIMNVLEKD